MLRVCPRTRNKVAHNKGWIYLLFIVVFGTIFMHGVSAYGVEYFVAESGNDENPGTLVSPWKTIAKANNSVKPGDSVIIRTGVYGEQINPVNSGLPGKPISYKAFPGEAPAVIERSRILANWHRLSGSVYWASYPSWAGGVWEDTFEQSGHYCAYWPQQTLSEVNGPGKYYADINTSRVYVWTKNGDDPNAHTMRTSIGNGVGYSSKNYILVDGISMRWVHRGVKVIDANHCTFLNLKIQYVADYGIWLSGQSSYNRIMNNTIYHVGSWYWKNGDGIFLDGGHHNLIDGNDISDIGHNPIATRGDHTDTYNNIIQNNKVHDSARSGLNANFNTHYEVWRNNASYRNIAAGIQNDSNNNIISKNIFYKNGSGIALYTTGNRIVHGNKVYGNTLYNNNTNTATDYVHEILIAEYRGGGLFSSNTFKNNLVYDKNKLYLVWFDGKLLKDNLFSQNNFYAGRQIDIRVTPLGVKPLSWWQQRYPSNFQGNLISDPLFVNAEEANFSLKAASPSIDAGSFLTKAAGSGRGNIINVLDAGYFCDGFGITAGDLIQIEGSAERVRIQKIDYDKQTIEIDGNISWKDGDGVSLPYSETAPDIGAFEYERI